jgi:4-hydroxybenzoate polyprenyltransferase
VTGECPESKLEDVVAFLIGAVLGMALMTMLWQWILKRVLDRQQLILGSVIAAYITMCVLYAFGKHEDGPIDWFVCVVPYGIAALIVLAFKFYMLLSVSKDTNG